MNLEICKKCTGYDSLALTFYKCKSLDNVLITLSGWNKKDCTYKALCQIYIPSNLKIDKFEKVFPDMITNMDCKYFVEQFLSQYISDI